MTSTLFNFENDDGCTVSATCILTGTRSTRHIKGLTPAMHTRWRAGELIQVAMEALTADDREFVMNGITPETWAETFGGGDPEESWTFGVCDDDRDDSIDNL